MAEPNPTLQGGQYPIGIPATHGDAALAGIVGPMGGMSLNNPGIPHRGGYPAPMGSTYLFPEQFVMAPVPGQHPMAMIDNPYGGAPTYIPTHHAGQFAHHMIQYPSVVPYTPRRPGGALNRSDRGHGEALPPLDSGRRGSSSTNESTPTTPFDRGLANRGNSLPVSIMGVDRSAYTTPSPQQVGLPALNGDHGIHVKQIPTPLDRNIEALLKQTPVIPAAVPAVFTPSNQIKTLEQSLENRIPGNRNVYIRGLHPTTDDDLLLRYTSRFGAVETSKAIIDTATGACKGFGFAKFHDESFNSRLKAEGDESSTNLYISNLPKYMNEMELGAIFADYTILSSKILRDSMGNSRGVGFARFETRDICDEVIAQFNNFKIKSEPNGPIVMNIRYADTPAQKELKRVTAERRQFRTNEYNLGAYGTPHVGLTAHAYGIPSFRKPYPATTPGTPRAHVGVSNGVHFRSEGGSSSQAGNRSERPGSVVQTPLKDDGENGSVNGEQSVAEEGSTTPGSSQSDRN
ncbi:related to single-stranded DNA-binding protein MSSP-1 [Cephalotrichum gorgonifer]|uniref:Related to single-stranded DNA-binding protein MSSP-1 n=1 Tax=Cephalotrichum gorgonifer TaxID=2041049 RepID=A0AAE8SSL5_9PEZI|nr:related to single-stranded DNA-binding protein MSSP-1 [Cephalotrichum gorgonifer]